MKLSEEDFDAVIAANLKGTFCMLHFVSVRCFAKEAERSSILHL